MTRTIIVAAPARMSRIIRRQSVLLRPEMRTPKTDSTPHFLPAPFNVAQRSAVNNNMNTLDCAIIGLGRIGSGLEDDTLREKPASHAGAIANHPRCRLAGGCDIDETKRTAFAARWNCTALWSDYRELLHDTKPDILHIATPPETHQEIVQAALDRKIPVIICEKPLAHTTGAAQAIANAARGSCSRIIVNHERRYALPYTGLHEIISSGRHGRLCSAHCQLFMGRTRSAAAMLLDDGTHLLDLLRYLLPGEPVVSHVAGSPDGDLTTMSILLHADTVPVTIHIGPGRDFVQFELDFSFERGRVRIGNGLFEEYVSSPSPYYERMRSLQKTDLCFRKTEYFAGMMREAVELCDYPERQPRSSAADGLRAVELIEEIIAGAREGQC
jgi:predicted dehydrogenase